jgi:Domain of unknown function (DUF5753)
MSFRQPSTITNEPAACPGTSRQGITLTDHLLELANRRVVGGESVMRAQLGRLAETSKQPNVTLQVLPPCDFT